MMYRKIQSTVKNTLKTLLLLLLLIVAIPEHGYAGDDEVSTYDPAISFSTYLGGSQSEEISALAIDNTGNIYVTGSTSSPNFPVTAGAYDVNVNGGFDVYISKLNQNGSALIYSTFLGGSKTDQGFDLAVKDGYVYVTGETESSNFPVTPGAFDVSFNGLFDAFISRLNQNGSELLYSTYLGGNARDTANGIDVDKDGYVYVTGITYSLDFPTTPGAFDTTFNGTDANVFVSNLNDIGSTLFYSTFLGGSAVQIAYDISLDSMGNAYIAGRTTSADFPVLPSSYDPTYNGGTDGFVSKLNYYGTTLYYSTFLGGSGMDICYAVDVDDADYAYVTGTTGSTNFPTLECYDCSFNGMTDVFITNLNGGGTGIFYSTYLGGTNDDGAFDIVLDATGHSWITGYTASPDFPTTPGAFAGGLNGINDDAFIGKIDYFGDVLHYSTYLGGPGIDAGKTIGVHSNSNIYVGGRADALFPTIPGSYDTTFNGGTKDGFVSKLSVFTTVPTATATPTPTPTPPSGNIQFELCNGLNLISFPYDSSISRSSALLADICPGHADSIWKYDCASKSFTSWNFLDAGQGWDVWTGMPFWVNITDSSGCVWQPAGTIPTGISFILCTGVNMVSMPVYCASIEWASDLIADVPNCTGVYLWGKIISCSNPPGFTGYFPISLPSEDFRVFPGDGLWVVVSNPASWTPPNP